MFYRLDTNNNIIDSANFKYSEDCLETDKNIVRDFNGKLVFEEETKTQEYQTALGKYEIDKSVNKRKVEIKQRLEELNKDFIQSMLGAVIPNIKEKEAEFISLHNELRVIQGKEPREYVKEE